MASLLWIPAIKSCSSLGQSYMDNRVKVNDCRSGAPCMDMCRERVVLWGTHHHIIQADLPLPAHREKYHNAKWPNMVNWLMYKGVLFWFHNSYSLSSVGWLYTNYMKMILSYLYISIVRQQIFFIANFIELKMKLNIYTFFVNCFKFSKESFIFKFCIFKTIWENHFNTYLLVIMIFRSIYFNHRQISI